MQEKLRVAIIMGGHPADHELTLRNGALIIDRLMIEDKYELKPVKVTKDRKWQFPKDYQHFWSQKGKQEFDEFGTAEALMRLKKEADVAFITPMSDWGENGILQGWLTMAGIPFTGPGVKTSSILRDKEIFSKILEANGFNIAPFVAFEHWEWKENPETLIKVLTEKIDFPAVVKPVGMSAGCSRGMSVARDEYSLEQAVEIACIMSNKIMAQKFIQGTEATCYVMNALPSKIATSLAPVKITYSGSDFFNTGHKQSNTMKTELFEETGEVSAEDMKGMAQKIYQLANCAGIIRVDVIVKDDKMYILEVNSLPTLFPEGMIIKAIAPLKIGFTGLLDALIAEAADRK